MSEKKLTPMQEAIDKVQSLKQIDAVINPIDVITTILKQMLKKEREEMCQFAFDYNDEYINNGTVPQAEEYFNETFKTKE